MLYFDSVTVNDLDFIQAEDGIRDYKVTGVQTCALPIFPYRRLNSIPAAWGTAVNIQAMVFGNKGEDSATGVCFTRNPASGENEFYGEFLINAQGEDVVAGIRTPQKIIELEKTFPKAYKQLLDIRKKLEKH